MIIRQFSQEQYDLLCRYLTQQGHSGPLDASYEVSMKVDDYEYRLRLQPGNKRKIAILQAVRSWTEQGEQHFQLITDNLPLSCLLELLLLERKSAEQHKKTCRQHG